LDADFGFTGHYFLSDANVHLALYRAYSANLGRWLSPDPLQASAPNRYAYVANNPISYVDPHGLDGWEVLQSIKNTWDATRQAFSEAPEPIRQAKEIWQKETELGKIEKELEGFDDSSQKLLNDIADVHEYIEDKDCGHSGAKLLDKMLGWFEGVQVVELTPIKLVREVLQKGVENVDMDIEIRTARDNASLRDANDRYNFSE
jgi:RHS repeat-associated protein